MKKKPKNSKPTIKNPAGGKRSTGPIGQPGVIG